MRSGSILPEFSSTIFFWRWKNGTFVADSARQAVACRRVQAADDVGRVVGRDVGDTSGLRSRRRPAGRRSTGPCSPRPSRALVLHARFGDFLLRARRAPRPRPRTGSPAAMHTQTWCGYLLLRLAFGLRRSCWSSSVVMGACLSGCAPASRSGPILPSTAPSITTAGARPQEPRQRAVSSESSPSGVVSPGLMPCCAFDGRQQRRRALDVTRRAGAHHAGVFALAA